MGDGMDEIEEIEQPEPTVEQEAPRAQQYEGDDIDALMTAKRRMAERDAEYSAKFKSLTDEPAKKPVGKATPKPAKRDNLSRVAESAPVAESNPAPNATEPVQEKRNPEMTAPTLKEAKAKVDKVIAKARSVGHGDVEGGLRSLNGKSSLPEASNDRAEYLKAWKKL